MQINFLELLQLYSYVIPTIIFYTLPISTFISLALSLSRLSSEYELIVITSFGLNPLKLVRVFLPIILLTTTFLLINSLILIPKSDSRYNAFKEKKRVEAQFNIRASEYGQQFASWLLYVDKEKDGLFKDIVLFKQENGEDTFIISKHATLKNNNLSLSLNLRDGKALRIKDNINQIDFKRMVLYSQLKATSNISTLDDLLAYWSLSYKSEPRKYKFVFSILTSVFPLISILFIISLGYYNPRYNKNRASAYAIVLTILFIIISQNFAKEFGFTALVAMPLLWISSSIVYYRQKIRLLY
jgi:lipopolysaccharide export system permease protein